MNLAEGHTGMDRIILSIFFVQQNIFQNEKRKKPPLFMVVTEVTKVYCRKFGTLVKKNEAQKHIILPPKTGFQNSKLLFADRNRCYMMTLCCSRCVFGYV